MVANNTTSPAISRRAMRRTSGEEAIMAKLETDKELHNL